MTGKPPHRPSGKTGAQEWERKDPALRKNASKDGGSPKPYLDPRRARAPEEIEKEKEASRGVRGHSGESKSE